MKVFISHTREEQTTAVSLKQQLEGALPGLKAWVSGIDLGLGSAWLQALDRELAGAKAMLVLCSNLSAEKPWINFEGGFGRAKEIPVIPVCHRGLRRDRLAFPLSMFQACDTSDKDDCAALVNRLAAILGINLSRDFSAEQMARSLSPHQERTHTVGVLLTHGQVEWTSDNSPFQLPDSLPRALTGRWTFQSINSPEKISAAGLNNLSGLIVGIPWRARMSPDTIEELVDWVHGGGRLLLLGYELGDRHHGGNLSELARRFGIHPMVDIVGPLNFGSKKPYGVWVDFQVSGDEQHDLTKGLSCIRLRNVQTAVIEPGGREWLRVGANAIYRPVRGHLNYRGGLLTQAGGAEFEGNAETGWVPVGVEAPEGLAAKGAVRFLGTWDLLRAPSEGAPRDNLVLVERLLEWLAASP